MGVQDPTVPFLWFIGSLIAVSILAFFISKNAREMDRTRIFRDAKRRNWIVHALELDPTGPTCGRHARTYRVRFLDERGKERVKTCHTSMMTGIIWNFDDYSGSRVEDEVNWDVQPNCEEDANSGAPRCVCCGRILETKDGQCVNCGHFQKSTTGG